MRLFAGVAESSIAMAIDPRERGRAIHAAKAAATARESGLARLIPDIHVEPARPQVSAIAGAPSGILAIVGRTAGARREGSDVFRIPIRIGSLREFENIFGAQPAPAPSTGTVHDAAGLFFGNGGRACWIVSTGAMSRPIAAADYRDALAILGRCDEPDLLIFPELALLGRGAYDVQRAALQHCAEHGNRFFLTEPLERLDGDASFDWRAGIDEFRQRLAGIAPEHARAGAAYSPRLIIAAGRQVAPGAAVAGIIAGLDGSKGIWKAPAGVGLAAVTGLSHAIDDHAQGGLNVDPARGLSINAIRDLPGLGIAVWGARTLAGNDGEWRYVSVRRFATWLRRSVERGIGWAASASNDAAAWSRATKDAEAFVFELWRRGALAGLTPKEAFFARAGPGLTMTGADIAAGRLILEIGIAPTKPGEFLLLRLQIQTR